MENKRERAAAALMFVFILFVLILIVPLQAQTTESEPVPRLNSNAGVVVAAPLNQTATYTAMGWGAVYGAGYNFSKHHSIVGEVMWNSLWPNDTALAPIRAEAQNGSIHGHGNLVTLTSNYRLTFEGKVYGAYVIGGGGLYYRDVSLSQPISVGSSVSCSPPWLMWGVTCSSGIVTANQNLASSNSTVLGGNIGIGFTFKLPDSHYKLYVESRYHYAPTKGVHTQLVPISLGIRF